MSEPVLEVSDLKKAFHIGFFRKRVDAVRGVDFQVRRGQVFGLLGPNGAGKTTTLKMVLRLIFPDQGSIRVFGMGPESRAAMQRVGYMPENPYIYRYLKAGEFLDLCGRLTGMSAALRRRRSQELIERMGLAQATDRPIGRFSKGMMQRIGLAQALLHDPELLVLDEPMSGLDPIGRRDVREVLLEQRERGKTLVFTSHILSDVERLCDHAVILRSGRVTARGAMSDLLRADAKRVEIELEDVTSALKERLNGMGIAIEVARNDHGENRGTILAEGDATIRAILEATLAEGALVSAITPARETLENLFLRDAFEETKHAS